MKKVFAWVFILALLTQAALGEVVKVDRTALYQTEKKFSMSGDAKVMQMAFNGTLGTLTVDAQVLDKSTYNKTQELIVQTGTSVSFSYDNISTRFGKKEYQWNIISDGARKIDSLDFGNKIEMGGILVQKSHDGSKWETAYQKCNVFKDYPNSVRKFYTASRNDLNDGCYYRVTIAYRTQYRAKKDNFLFVDTSTYEKRWHVEMYDIYLLADDYSQDYINANLSETDSGITVGTQTILHSNLSGANQAAALEEAQESFTHGVGDHGFAAENANMEAEIRKGNDVKYTGKDNAKNGPDYIVTNSDGITYIQSKYCKTPSRTISACFEDGSFRYMADSNTPMVIEVPSDQYDQCVELMRKRISNKQVPGVTDPNDAEKLIKRGSVTYQQAVNLAKAGTIDSLIYDAKTGAVTSASAFGVSAVVEFAVSLWSGEPADVALKKSIHTGIRVGGSAFIVNVLSSQLTRAGLNSLLVPGSEAVIHAIGPKAAAAIVNIGRIGLTPIYGAAAMKSAAKLLRSNVIVSTISLVVFSIPDAVDLFNRRISVKQMVKNLSVSVGGLAGAAGGGAAGAAAGSAVFPGTGTIVGGIVGGVLGGLGVSIGVDKLSDLIADDDADEMQRVLITEFTNLVEEYLLNQEEVDKVSEGLQKKLEENGDVLKDMFASTDRNVYARNMIMPLVTNVINKRKKAALPDDATIKNAMVNVLEDIDDMYENEQ